MAPESQARSREITLLRRLQEHELLDCTELEVRVRGDVAFIEGAVPNLRQKRLAEEVAIQVEGIRDVVNMLRVTPLTVIDDDSLRARIGQALARNHRIDAAQISVDVVDGVVYLYGQVDTATQKRLAEQEVWSVAGVRDIVNRIDVLSATPKSEMQITGEILQSFSECLGLDLSRLSVETKDGIVHLSGIVPTDYLKDAAEELATWTPSVKGVVNELKVLELPGFKRHTPTRLVRLPLENCQPRAGVTSSRSLAGGSSAFRSATGESSSNASRTTA
jgi:hyperosmotically inducible protein